MQHVKITQPGFEGFTGDFGQIAFVDGVSVEPLTQRHIDRMAACLLISVVGEDGEEEQGGVAARLVGGATIRAEVTGPMRTQSESDKAAELARKSIAAGVAPLEKMYTLEELEEIASKDGIAGLRPIGKPWGVKGRAIPDLIEAILKAQAEFTELNGGSRERLVTEATRNEPAAPVIPGIEKPAADHVAETDTDTDTETETETEGEGEPDPALGGGDLADAVNAAVEGESQTQADVETESQEG